MKRSKEGPTKERTDKAELVGLSDRVGVPNTWEILWLQRFGSSVAMLQFRHFLGCTRLFENSEKSVQPWNYNTSRNNMLENYSYDYFRVKISLKFLVKSFLHCFFTDHLKQKKMIGWNITGWLIKTYMHKPIKILQFLSREKIQNILT